MKEISTTIVLDADTLKVAQGRRTRSGVILLAFLTRKISGLSDEDIGRTLRETLGTLPHKTTGAQLLLPRHFAIIRTIDLPSTEETEIRELAGFQAVKQTPYSIDEMVLDIQIIQKDAESSKVSMVVVQKEIVERLVRIAKMANLAIHAIRLATQGYEAVFYAAVSKGQLTAMSGEIAGKQPDAQVPGHPTIPSEEDTKHNDLDKPASQPQDRQVALVSIDYSRSHLVILSGEKSCYSRSIPLGWQILNEGPGGSASLQQKLADELKLSFLAYRKENPKAQVQTVYFESDVHDWNILCGFLQHQGYGKPHTLDPMQLVSKGPHTRIELETDQEVCRGDLIGALLMPSRLTLNLLPENYKREQQSLRRRRHIVQLLIFSSVFLILCLAHFLESVADKKLYLRQLRGKLDSIKSRAAAVESRAEKLDLVSALAAEQGEVANVLRELYELFPDSASLSALSYERGRTLIIKGTAKDLSDVFQLIPVLENSPYFENVTSQYASKRRIYNKEYTDFQIQCFISKYKPPPSGTAENNKETSAKRKKR